MCHGIGDQPDPQFGSDLLHNSSLAYSRRSHQKNRPLVFNCDLIFSVLILGEICDDRVLDLFFCILDIHSDISLELFSYLIYISSS